MEDKYYEIVEEFNCNGKHMITVKIGRNVHVMDYVEWRKIYGRNHQEKWTEKVDWNSFDSINGYKKLNIS